MRITTLITILFVVGTVNGEELRISSKEPVIVLAPAQWKVKMDKSPSGPFPFETYRIEPPLARNGVCLISIYDKDKREFADITFLKKLLRGDSRPYVNSPSDLAKVEIKELKIDGGLGFYANFVDPDLVGKPVTRGSYKVATPIIVSLSMKYLIKVTVLCDEVDGPDYRDAMAIVKSIKIKRE